MPARGTRHPIVGRPHGCRIEFNILSQHSTSPREFPREDRAAIARRAIIALAVVFACWLRFAGPLLWDNGTVYLHESTVMDVPFRLYAARRAAQGDWPTWSPHLFCGFPLFAYNEAGMLYPLHWPLIAFPTPKANDVIIATHYLIAGWGMAAYSLSRGFRAPAAILGAVWLMTSSPMQTAHAQPVALQVFTYIPLALACVDRATKGSTVALWLAAGINGLTMFIGQPEIVLQCFLMELLLLATAEGASMVGFARQAILLVAFPFLLSAAQMLPLYLFFHDSNRTALDTSATSIHRTMSVLQLLPGRNAPSTHWPTLDQGGRVGGALALWDYLSMLVMASIAVTRATPRRFVYVWSSAGFLGALIGTQGWLARLVFKLPILSWFHFPLVFLLQTLIGYMILAAAGVDWVDRTLRDRFGSLGSIIVGGLVFVGCWSATFNDLGKYLAFPNPIPTHSAIADQVRNSDGRLWVEGGAWDACGDPFRASDLAQGLEPLPPNVNLLFNVRSANLYNHQFVPAPAPMSELQSTIVTLGRRLELTSCTHVSSLRPVHDDRGLERLPNKEICFYRVKAPTPRAYIVHEIERWSDPKERLTRLNESEFNPGRVAIVETSIHLDPAPMAPSKVAWTQQNLRTLRLEVDSVATGLLVIADTFSRGWRATLNGQATPVLKTNHAFCGVVVPGGKHVVELSYSPWEIPVGFALSLLGWSFWTWRVGREWMTARTRPSRPLTTSD